MGWLSDWGRRMGALLGREREKHELQEEFEFHLEMEVEANLRAGMDPHEARRRARLSFGGTDWYGERVREEQGARILEDLMLDLRYAFRQLRKNPVFAGAAILTLALGIGGNTAVFSILNGVALRPLGYREPESLVQVWPRLLFTKSGLSRLEEETESFSQLSGFSSRTLTLTGVDEAEAITSAVVSVGHFSMLGTSPALGRSFSAEEQEPASSQVVILSHDLWIRGFGGDPDILGGTIELAGERGGLRTVVGVMPEGYRPIRESWEVWIPLVIDPTDDDDFDGLAQVRILGRLAPGATASLATAEIQGFASRAVEDGWRVSDEQLRSAGVTSLHDQLFGSHGTRILILMAAVGLLLLIACSNITNLLLARAGIRRQEFGIRVSLGAGRSRLIRQLTAESLALGALGGGIGLLLAFWTLPLLLNLLPAGTPRVDQVTLDGRVLIFTLLLSLGASLVFGLIPALHSSGRGIALDLKKGSAVGSFRTGGRRLMNAMVVAEVALSLVMLSAAGLMLKSFWRLQNVDPGFRAEGLVSILVQPPESRYPGGEIRQAYFGRLMDRLSALPGVSEVGMTSASPMSLDGMGASFDSPESLVPEEDRPRFVDVQSVSSGYFETLGIGFSEGADLDGNTLRGPPQLVVNQRFAEMLWPGEEAVGKHVDIPAIGIDQPFTVVGVANDIHQLGLDRTPSPEVFVPYTHLPHPYMYVTTRLTSDEEEWIPALQDAVRSVDTDVPFTSHRMVEMVNGSVDSSRLLTVLLSLFGAMGLAIVAVGIFGLVFHAVVQRTQEIGIRMAVGASGNHIAREILGSTLILVAVGIMIGTAGGIGTLRVMTRFLFQVSAADPVTLLGVGAVLFVVALLASLVPVRRAVRVSPVQTLKEG